MIFVPVSFIGAAVFLLAVLRLWRQGRQTGPLLPVFLLVMAGLAVLAGLRWGYGFTSLGRLQAAVALVTPPLGYLAFRRLGERPRPRDLVHAVPALSFMLAASTSPWLLDVVIPLQAFVYGLLVIRLARQGPDALPGIRLSEGGTAACALRLAAGGLLMSAAVDVAVGVDFAITGGAWAALLVSIAQTAALLVAGVAVALAGDATPDEEEDDTARPQEPPSEDEKALVERIERLVRQQELHKSADLTLSRLARRAQVPARQVSAAVNRVRGESVSRFLNRIRVEEACRLLASGDDAVTEVMGAAGFQTKSNFNRVFREITGKGPAEWRLCQRAAEDVPSTISARGRIA